MLAQWTRVGDVATAPVGPNRNPLTAKKIWSGRRGSNPRPRPWQGRALPLSYTRIRDVGDRSPATAELCQMQAANATVRTRLEAIGESDFLSKLGPNAPKQRRNGIIRLPGPAGGNLGGNPGSDGHGVAERFEPF